MGGVDVKEGIYIAQCTQYLQGVHLLVVGRDVTRRMNGTILSNSRYSRHLIASGNGLANFNSTLILPSDAPWSGVGSKSSTK